MSPYFSQTMKTQHHLLAITLLAVTSLAPAWGQGFDAGSNGSLGNLDVIDADRTVELPSDGRLQYKSITVAAGRTLRFTRNTLNTPVHLLAQSDIVIDGVININGGSGPGSPPIGGVGGPGGFDGGKPGFGGDFPPGDGYGPGAGGSGNADNGLKGAGGGGYGTPGGDGASTTLFQGVTYGSPLLIPLMGGSGGGGDAGTPGKGGGGGGGAILVASNTKIRITGSILSIGGGFGGPSRNAGSGGAIRLLSPRVEGQGNINVGGGSGGGGVGRIRVDCLDKTALQLNFQPLSVTTVGANMFVDPFTTPPTGGGLTDGNSNTVLVGERKVPRLDIIAVAGETIALDTGSTVRIQLPFGSDANRTVTLRAQNFNADVPIRLTLTPDSGRRIVIDTNIVNKTAFAASVTIPVGLPANTLVTIHAWTR